MFVVDTNILVYAADRECTEFEVCHQFVEECRQESFPWYLTWNIFYEFLRVVSHPRVFRQPWPVEKAWEFVLALLSSPSLGVLVHTQRHSAIAEETMREVPLLRGNLVHDAHTAILMREHGINKIYTRDTDFHRFPFLEVIDPLS